MPLIINCPDFVVCALVEAGGPVLRKKAQWDFLSGMHIIFQYL